MVKYRDTSGLHDRVLAALTILGLVFLPELTASAAIYKCVDLDGIASYSKSACQDEDILDRIIADNGVGDARRVPAETRPGVGSGTGAVPVPVEIPRAPPASEPETDSAD